jgi:hypothetical protein
LGLNDCFSSRARTISVATQPGFIPITKMFILRSSGAITLEAGAGDDHDFAGQIQLFLTFHRRFLIPLVATHATAASMPVSCQCS